MGEAISGTAVATAVRVISVSRVVPNLSPAEHAGVGHVKLSFLDVAWINLPAIQRVFLYDLPGGADAEFPAVIARLKHSLAATLALYLPLAGKLATAADTGDFFVDLSDDFGVAFVDAEMPDCGAADVRRLAGDEALDIPAFLGLAPELDFRALPAPVLSVQATRLGTGGLALGLSVLHTVLDGAALWRFTEAWASTSREGSPVTRFLGPPHYSRDHAVFHPRGEELTREMLKLAVAPDMPPARSLQIVRRTFNLNNDDIISLKHRIDGLSSAVPVDGEAPGKPVSSFVALSALCWSSFVRSKRFAAGDDTYLMFSADLRTRLDPPVGDGYLGNCVSSCLATAAAGELQSDTGLLRAARAIQMAVAEMEAAPVPAMFRWMKQLGRVPFARVACVVASPRFRVYDASDFGFGRPARVELMSMIQDGQIVLGGGSRDGEVQISVSLDTACVDAFMAHTHSSWKASAR